ncbi:MAG: hypothetical protein EON56_06000 [Alphaproteobacteria bacterium]|jgi:hypothetical protein|nr:MAG: hypothetical protein EON56_06000 [Alphaproteobacteria bacterium]
MAIAFLPAQPAEGAEFLLTVDPTLMSAIHRWTESNGLKLSVNDAATVLLRQALGAQGFEAGKSADVTEQRSRALLAGFYEAAGLHDL